MTHILIIADVALACLALAIVMRQRLKGDRRTWRLFWLGFLLGLTWEAGFFLTGPLFSSAPSYQMSVRFPGHPALQPVLHSLLDGVLFLAGTWTVRLFCQAPTFRGFRSVELLVLMMWGNVQELAVEIFACATGLWTFLPRS